MLSSQQQRIAASLLRIESSLVSANKSAEMLLLAAREHKEIVSSTHDNLLYWRSYFSNLGAKNRGIITSSQQQQQEHEIHECNSTPSHHHSFASGGSETPASIRRVRRRISTGTYLTSPNVSSESAQINLSSDSLDATPSFGQSPPTSVFPYNNESNNTSLEESLKIIDNGFCNEETPSFGSPSMLMPTKAFELCNDIARNIGDDVSNISEETAETVGKVIVHTSPYKLNFDILPKCFQSGEGAVQIQKVYSLLEQSTTPQSIDELQKKTVNYEKERLALLLTTLQSRHFAKEIRSGTWIACQPFSIAASNTDSFL